MKRKDLLFLLLLTLAGLLVHGYHPLSEDSETYLPAVERLLNPKLFPIGSQYFLLHSHLTFFPDLIVVSVRLLHLSLPWTLFLWHLLSLFLFVLACWSLAKKTFDDPCAQWCGVTLVTALWTIPVAGSALYILDQFVNPRNLIAFAVIFAIIKVLDRKYLQALLFLLSAAAIHPFMTTFAVSFCLLLGWMERSHLASSVPAPVLVSNAAGLSLFEPPSEAYKSVANNHRYQFLARWEWYEFLGALAPLAILYWFSLTAKARKLRNLEIMCRALIMYGAIYFVAGLVVSIPERLALLSRLQPMRSFYLVYVLFFLFAGGFLGQFLLKRRPWRWLLLFLPLCGGMYIAQRALFPSSAHIEWPWLEARNPWARAFLWARDHTPSDAIFTLDPYYMRIEGEDAVGFRATAERSQLADGGKDGGVVEMFPQIGDAWLAQVKAQTGIDSFKTPDFVRLQSEYGVQWVILRQPNQLALVCPYQNEAVKVCRVP